MRKVRYIIQAFNQPGGNGDGWAPCHANRKDAVFFVFRADTGERIARTFGTRVEAKQFVAAQRRH